MLKNLFFNIWEYRSMNIGIIPYAMLLFLLCLTFLGFIFVRFKAENRNFQKSHLICLGLIGIIAYCSFSVAVLSFYFYGSFLPLLLPSLIFLVSIFVYFKKENIKFQKKYLIYLGLVMIIGYFLSVAILMFYYLDVFYLNTHILSPLLLLLLSFLACLLFIFVQVKVGKIKFQKKYLIYFGLIIAIICQMIPVSIHSMADVLYRMAHPPLSDVTDEYYVEKAIRYDKLQ